MIYDLSKEIDKERLATRVKALTAKGAIVEFTEKAVRSNSQNRYLHALLGALAIDTGETLEYVKEMYFKRLANRELFISTRVDKYCGTVEEVRSSADLSVEEMSVAIDRLKRWAAQEGFYLPEPGDEERILDIEREILRMKRYI